MTTLIFQYILMFLLVSCLWFVELYFMLFLRKEDEIFKRERIVMRSSFHLAGEGTGQVCSDDCYFRKMFHQQIIGKIDWSRFPIEISDPPFPVLNDRNCFPVIGLAFTRIQFVICELSFRKVKETSNCMSAQIITSRVRWIEKASVSMNFTYIAHTCYSKHRADESDEVQTETYPNWNFEEQNVG